MQYGKLLRTLRHLKVTQVVHQVLMRVHKPRFREEPCPSDLGGLRGIELKASFPAKPRSLEGEEFTFLNLAKRFEDWNDTEFGMLWAYNLNYMDYLLQEGMSAFDGRIWVDRYIRELTKRTIGQDPYPTALRLMNWAKFCCLHYKDRDIPQQWRDAYYSQLRHLERRLEFHLLGNHLLEDASGLYIGWLFLKEGGERLHRARRLMLCQLREQTLSDGAHYDQSPMYHCILLDRLLDALNFAMASDDEAQSELQEIAVRQLGFLQAVVWADGTIPLFGDSAIGIAPSPDEIFGYARRLGLTWQPLPLGESGYRRWKDGEVELIADVGRVTAVYQPGHTHSDVFTFEMRIAGQPLCVDTGISTYEKNARRQYERSYEAHNVAQIDGEEPFEVWGGFRVGAMASVRLLADGPRVEAERRGRNTARRAFEVCGGQVRITDNTMGKEAVARFHLAPGLNAGFGEGGMVHTDLADFRFEGGDVKVEILEVEVSTAYNQLRPAVCIEVRFQDRLESSVLPLKQAVEEKNRGI